MAARLLLVVFMTITMILLAAITILSTLSAISINKNKCQDEKRRREAYHNAWITALIAGLGFFLTLVGLLYYLNVSGKDIRKDLAAKIAPSDYKIAGKPGPKPDKKEDVKDVKIKELEKMLKQQRKQADEQKRIQDIRKQEREKIKMKYEPKQKFQPKLPVQPPAQAQAPAPAAPLAPIQPIPQAFAPRYGLGQYY